MYCKLFLLTIYVCFTSCKIVIQPIKGDLDWWQSSIIYEIFPLSFKDSDGDGSGDFKGVKIIEVYFRCILHVFDIIN